MIISTDFDEADEATKNAIKNALNQTQGKGNTVNNNLKIGQQNINFTVNNNGMNFTL